MAEKKIPLRMCIACREMKSKKELIRIVRAFDGGIIVDDAHKIAGRGAYLCKSKVCFAKCIKIKALSRQFGCVIDGAVLERISAKVNKEDKFD